MSRDHRKLRVLAVADDLVLEMYRISRPFPHEERYGLRAQLRSAALSVACNIVEGSARDSTREYRHFLTLALGSAVEGRYLLSVAARLEYVTKAEHAILDRRYFDLVRALQRLCDALASRQ